MTELSNSALKKMILKWFEKSIYSVNEEEIFKTVQSDLLYELFFRDYARYFNDTKIYVEHIEGRLELVGILTYRIANYFFTEHQSEGQAEKFSNLGRFLSGFEIYYSAAIGEGLKINHGLGTVIGARTKIGRNVLIHQGVTFGDRNGGRPILGDNVIVYAGAKILGPVRVGNNAIIAANCVCISDVPDNSTVVGVPGRVITK